METHRQVRKRQKLNEPPEPSHSKLSLSGHALKLIVQWLEPQDVLNCVQTCRQWKDEIDEEVWIEVAKNLSPFAVAVIDAEAVDKGRSESVRLDYRSIALSVAHTYGDNSNSSSSPKITFPKPRLRLEDILVLIEFRDGETKKPMGACFHALTEFHDLVFALEPLKSWGFELRGESLRQQKLQNIFVPISHVMEELEKYSEIFDPASEATESAYDELEMRSCLIRLDTENNMHGKHFRLIDFTKNSDFRNDGGACFFSDDFKPMASNGAGTVARELCFHKEYAGISADLDIILEPADRQWAKAKQAQGQTHTINWKEELRKVGDKFEYRYRFMSLRFHDIIDDCSKSFKSSDDLLLILEGLNWQ